MSIVSRARALPAWASPAASRSARASPRISDSRASPAASAMRPATS
ncbi:MAG: hypothetical protein IT372_36425 [Polyangiaceae bacterium]|nr:hypothetical protein [Polyangiaceae bacterium]